MINLHDMSLKNVEIQMGQLTQAMQSRNNTTFQEEKGCSSKGKEQYLAIQTQKTEKDESCVRKADEVKEKEKPRERSWTAFRVKIKGQID